MVRKLPSNGYLLGLDVGEKRIGVAVSSVIARLPRPAGDILQSASVYQEIQKRITDENVAIVVVGIPRNLNGEETSQSQSIRVFADKLSQHISIPIAFADESLSSIRADEALKDKQFKGVSRDSLAACFILEEYIRTSTIESVED